MDKYKPNKNTFFQNKSVHQFLGILHNGYATGVIFSRIDGLIKIHTYIAHAYMYTSRENIYIGLTYKHISL